MSTVREYRGVLIHPLGANSWGGRYGAYTAGGFVKADTLAGIKELTVLDDLAAVASDYAPDWHYGETLIRDSYFQDYAQELAEDVGAIDAAATWPNTCIDWEWAARELQMDYTAVEFDGVTYWTR